MAGDTSRINGRKVGRPKGYAALQAEKAREILVEALMKDWKHIVLKAVAQALGCWRPRRGSSRHARPFSRGEGRGAEVSSIANPSAVCSKLAPARPSRLGAKREQNAFLKITVSS